VKRASEKQKCGMNRLLHGLMSQLVMDELPSSDAQLTGSR
jgi:hypothetical protein